MTEYNLYRSETLNNMIVMLPSSQSSYERHSQWSDSDEDDNVSRRTKKSFNPASFIFLFLKKKFFMWIKNEGWRWPLGVSSLWHRVLAVQCEEQRFTAPTQGLGQQGGVGVLKWCDTVICCAGWFTVRVCLCTQGSRGEGANTSRRCNQSQRTCSARRSSALGVLWAGSISEPLR